MRRDELGVTSSGKRTRTPNVWTKTRSVADYTIPERLVSHYLARPTPEISYRDCRNGIANQEAPQTYAQEEAQEDVEGHPLATPGGQVTL